MKGFRICRIFGIDIKLDLSWFFIFALFSWQIATYLRATALGQPAILYWIAGALVVLIFFISVLFHELAHSLVAKKFNIPIKDITLHLFGGAAQLGTMPKTAKDEFWMALAGPLSSLVVAAFFLAISSVTAGIAPKLVSVGLEWLGVINIALAVFNIIPIFPMDGGRVLRSLWWWKTKNLIKATKAAVNIAIVVAVILSAVSIFFLSLFSAIIIVAIMWLFVIPGGIAEYNIIKNG